jgi:uncharacterized protein
MGHFIPSRTVEPPWERLNLKLPDGDALRIRLVPGRTKVVVHLFHGLGGSADSDYMRRSAARFWSMGHSVMAINHRGAGEGAGLAVKPYHMGATSDVAAMIQVGRGFFPEHLHVAIGFSLSATALLLLLSRDRESGLALPDRAMAVNPAVDLEKASRRMGQGLNRMYDQRFVLMLKRQIRERWEFGLMPDEPKFPRFMSLRAFDELYTAPESGFRNRADYYARCTCTDHLCKITTPTVILGSQDDPFATISDLDGVPLSDAVHLHSERFGGHMGYLSQNIAGRRWMDYALDHYLNALIDMPVARNASPGFFRELEVEPVSAFEGMAIPNQ